VNNYKEQLWPQTIEDLLVAIDRLKTEGGDNLEIIGTSDVMRDMALRILALERKTEPWPN
jgi:hypothetical protein